MRSQQLVPSLLVALASPIMAQSPGSPYTELVHRDIKALSAEQIEQYLSGAGMGFALAAELNGLPGPKHVLELADQLALTAAQQHRTQELFDALQERAVSLGRAIVEQEATLDSLFVTRSLTASGLESRVAEIAVTRGKLRYEHLRAHLMMTDVLTNRQIRRYQDLRGYSDHAGGKHRPGG